MEKIKKKYMFLIVIVILGIVVGILFSNILNTEDNKLVADKIMTFFNNLKDDIPISYTYNLFASIKNNLIYLIVIWVFGLSVIGLLFNNFILFLKSFILGFSIGSIINVYLYNGIILSFLYVFPSSVINIIVFIIMVYYANIFSLKIFRVLFRKEKYSFNILIKKYIKILLYLSFIMILSSVIETFIMPFLIKLFSFLIK